MNKNQQSRIGEFVEVEIVSLNEKDMWVNFDADKRTWGCMPLNPDVQPPQVGTKVWACIIGERIGDISKDPHDVMYKLVTGARNLEKIIAASFPSIRDGRVVIRESVVRGHGSKIAVSSLVYSDPREQLLWDLKLAVQAGLHKVLRVNIDFARYSSDIHEYVSELLGGVEIYDLRADFVGRKLDLTVDRSDVYRVLGKNGINVFLTQELLGMKVKVHAKTIHFPELEENIPGKLIHQLLRSGVKTSQDLAEIFEQGNKDGRISDNLYKELRDRVEFKYEGDEDDDEPLLCPTCGHALPDNVDGDFKCPNCGATLQTVWDED